MKKDFHRIIVVLLAVVLTMTMFPLPAFAVEVDPSYTADTQQLEQEDQGEQEEQIVQEDQGEQEDQIVQEDQGEQEEQIVQEDQPVKGGQRTQEKQTKQEDQTVQEDQGEQQKGTPQARNTDTKSKRTIMLYDCGSNLETDAGLATYNLMQILESSFSSDDDIKFLVMTGGSHTWQLDNEMLVFPDEVTLPDDAVVAYDADKREYVETPSDPKSQVSNVYNQIWEAKGIDAAENAGKLVLLDGDGITKTDGSVKSKDELMSDPDTLKAFINYGVENYPSEKYDLILWDHGGGPTDGFGMDEHLDDSDDWNAPSTMSFASITEALSDNAVTNNDANDDGEKDTFDFIDFDACLMNSVELAIAMADYTDYYIASAETEPGYGQYYGPCAEKDGKQYKGWLDELGDPENDSKYNEPGGTYELGKVIVDDFYNFYEKETGDGHSQEGTLAVVDTKKMMASEFVETLTVICHWLKAGAGNVEENGVHFYDELKSYYNSIEYGGSELFDLGNLSALLSVSNAEVSEDHMDEDDNYYITENDYHDIARTLNEMLVDGTFMYAKGTSGITTEEQYYKTLDDQLGHGRLGSSGMSIYFPGLEMTMSVTDYYKEIDPVIDRLPDNDKRKTFLKDYEKAIAYYSVILYSGKVIDLLINDEDNALETARKSDVDYDMIESHMKNPIFGNWDTLVEPCRKKMGIDEESLASWLRVLIPQQANDAVDGKEVKLERLDQQETGACKVKVNGAKKRIINSVERNIYVELPALEEYVSGLPVDKQKTVNGAGQLSVGSVEGTYSGQPAGDSIREMIKWYNESGGEWRVEPFDEKWYAVSDAGGAKHVASIYLSDEDGIYVPAIVETSADESSTSGNLMLEFSPENDHKLKSVYYMNTETGPVKVEPQNLTREITVMPAIVIKQMFDPDIYVPISRSPFTISSGNAGSIDLDYVSIAGIADIGDTDGDGKVFDTAITITDMYGYKIRVSDRVHIKRARIKPGIRTGEELVPELVYRGKTLRPGIDYILEKEKIWNEETHMLEEPAFVEPGDYNVALYGKGPFTGRIYDVIFRIVPEDEAVQTFIDEAQANLKDAQDDFASLDPDDSVAMQQVIDSLSAAQNALTDAQNELDRTKDTLDKDQIAQLEGQIAQLKDQIEDLNDRIAELSVIDISNYTVTMKTSFPYTGSAIRPAVKVSGLSESCYTVSYSNNTNVGTGKVTITAKGNGYKGTITKTFKIVKAANPLKVEGKTAKIKYSKLKKKSQKLAATKVIKFTKQLKDKKTYTLSSAKKGKKSFKKYFKINKTTGKVTVKKGLKKGKYKLKVKVKAAGNANYKASATKTVTFTVKVR